MAFNRSSLLGASPQQDARIRSSDLFLNQNTATRAAGGRSQTTVARPGAAGSQIQKAPMSRGDARSMSVKLNNMYKKPG